MNEDTVVLSMPAGAPGSCGAARGDGGFRGRRRVSLRPDLRRVWAWGSLLFLFLGIPLARAQAPGETGWLDIELRPEARRLVRGQLVAALNGTTVGLVPATIPLPTASASDPHELRLFTLDGAYVFVVRLVLEGGKVSVLDARTEACKALKVQAGIAWGGVRWRLRIELLHKGAPVCQGTHTAEAAGERVKIRFESAPDGAEIYYPESPSSPASGKSSKDPTYDARFKGKTARTLTVDFVPGVEMTVFFKKPGFQDGVTRFRMEQDGEGKWLVFGTSRLPLGRAKKDRDAPAVSTILQPFPVR
jgi:hypothetical protein